MNDKTRDHDHDKCRDGTPGSRYHHALAGTYRDNNEDDLEAFNNHR